MKGPVLCASPILATWALLSAPSAASGGGGREDEDPPPPPSQVTEPEQKDEWTVYWKDGTHIDGPEARIKFGGRFMFDMGYFTGTAFENATGEDLSDYSGAEFRRLRFFIEGEIFDNVKFKTEYDFANDQDDGEVALKDAYFEFISVWGNPRFGHFKEPFSLEELTSSRFIQFMERSTANDTIAPKRNTGAMIGDTVGGAERATWALGFFQDSGDNGFDQGNDWATTGRLTWLPVYASDGERLVHLGIAASQRPADSSDPGVDPTTNRYRARPEAHLLPYFLDTGDFAADSSSLVNLEAAWVGGPWSLQGEYMAAATDAAQSGDPDFSGYYVEGSWFVTGEHRAYKKSSAAFDRVVPNTTFSKDGPGAVQLALRYSHSQYDGVVDTDGDVVPANELDDVTFGVNWHQNRNSRVMFNYVNSTLESVDEPVHAFMVRFQVDF